MSGAGNLSPPFLRPRRLAIVPVSYDLLSAVLLGRVSIVENVPEDATVIEIRPGPLFGVADLIVESKSFTPLCEGDQLPRLRPLLKIR